MYPTNKKYNILFNFFMPYILLIVFYIFLDDIKEKFSKVIPLHQPAILLDIPVHKNYGDSLIWYAYLHFTISLIHVNLNKFKY